MMRSLVVALLAVSSAAVAQDSSAAAPKGPTKAEFRVGGFMVNGDRSYDISGNVRNATGSIKGVEVLLRGSGIGLSFRSLSGTFGTQPQVISADAQLLLFPPVFTIHAGAGKRALSSDLGTNVRDVIMLGVSSTVNIGGTGWRTHISAMALASPAKDPSSPSAGSSVEDTSTGLEGEAAVFYRMAKVPLFITIGYRTEVFTGKSPNLTTPEEVRGLRVGGGIQFGGR